MQTIRAASDERDLYAMKSFHFEKLKGQPVKEKTMIGLQYVGLALLLALVIFATKNDFVNFGLVRKILSLFG